MAVGSVGVQSVRTPRRLPLPARAPYRGSSSEDAGNTLATVLRAALESACPDDFSACRSCPLDRFVEVEAPSEAAVRRALLEVKYMITECRARPVEVLASARPAPE